MRAFWFGFFFALATLLPTMAQAATCHRSLPPASERAGRWEYRLRHGAKCWHGPRSRAVRRASRTRSAMQTHARVPRQKENPAARVLDDGIVWPKIDTTSFESRWKGESP